MFQSQQNVNVIKDKQLKNRGGEKIINYSSRGVSTAAVGIIVGIVVGIVVGVGVYTLKPGPKPVPVPVPMIVESVSTGMSTEPGSPATVQATIKNIGDNRGSETFNLRCEGEVVDTKSITLDPGKTGTLSFSVTKDEAGVYDVDVGGKTATLRVSPVIRILIGNWPTARTSSRILELTYNEMGYETEVRETSIAIAYKTLVENDADLWTSEWWPSHVPQCEGVPGAMELPVIGVNRLTYDEGIAVPRYVYDNMEADLGRQPRLKDLPKYGEKFNYTIYTSAPGYAVTRWSKALTDEMLGGKWKTFVAGSTIAGNAQMLAAINKKEWCAYAFWDPTYLWAIADIIYLENPTPESGDYQFGVKGKGQLRTRSRIGFREDFPDEVVGLAEAFLLQQEPLAIGARETTSLWVSKEDISAMAAAHRWMNEHRDIVEGWIETARG